MAEAARDFTHMEMTGDVRDSVYFPDGEDEDPEITELVMDQYAEMNARRHVRHLHEENSRLRDLLRENGIETEE